MEIKIAIQKAIQKEGGYVNDPQDLGGETYKGISRKNHPKWSGWVILDKIPNKKRGQIFENSTLDKEVEKFYLEYLKDIQKNIINLEQEFANKVVGIAINVGVSKARELLKNS